MAPDAPEAPTEEGAAEFRCPICDTVVPEAASNCRTCGADFLATSRRLRAVRARPRRRLRGEYTETDVREIARVPGVGPGMAERLCSAGFATPWKVHEATEERLAKVPGIGPGGAKTIKTSLRIVLILPRSRTREQALTEEYACPMCGCLTSMFAPGCHDCGAEFEGEDIGDALQAELTRDGDRSELAFYEVRLMEDPGDPHLWYARGLLFRDMGQVSEAIASFDRALDLAPNAPRVLLARASVMAQVREVGRASRHLRDSIAGLVHDAATKLAVLEEREVEVEAIAALAGIQERRCPVCGEPVVPGAEVCPACNSSLVPGPEAPTEAEADDAGVPPSADETPPPPEPEPEMAGVEPAEVVPPQPLDAVATEIGVAAPPTMEESPRPRNGGEPSGRVRGWAAESLSRLVRGLRAALPILAPGAVAAGAGVYVVAFAGLGQGPPAMAALMIGGVIAVALGIALRRPA